MFLRSEKSNVQVGTALCAGTINRADCAEGLTPVSLALVLHTFAVRLTVEQFNGGAAYRNAATRREGRK